MNALHEPRRYPCPTTTSTKFALDTRSGSNDNRHSGELITLGSDPVMPSLPSPVCQVFQLTKMVLMCVADGMRFFTLCLRSRSAPAAENLFLRQQLALYQERHAKPRRVTTALRITLVWLSRWFDWQSILTIVRPETFKRWRRQRMGVSWKEQVQRGRPPIPPDLQVLIRQMARENLTWGQTRIANELRLKLGLQVSPRTVRKYVPSGCDRGPGQCVQGQRWRTFMRNYAEGLIISDLSTVLSRGWHVLSTRVIELLQCWQARSTAGEWWRVTPNEAPSIVFRCSTRSLCLEDFAYPADVPRVADRSPPAIGPSRIRYRMSAETPMSTSDVCPVELALDQWKLARLHVCGTEFWCKGRNQAILLCRVT